MLVTLLLALVALAMAEEGVLRGSPAALRRDALSAPLPSYPAEATATRVEGLVVVEVCVLPVGTVASVRLVDTFSNEAFASVERTVKRWRFRPLPPDHQVSKAKRIGRLLFSFSRKDGTGLVVDLAEQSLTKALRRAGDRTDRKAVTSQETVLTKTQ